MTRADQLASVLKRLGDALYLAADDLNAIAAEVATESVGPERPAGAGAASSPGAAPPSLPPSIDELPFDDALIPDEFREPQGSEAVCPAHRKPFVEGKFGPYCPSKGTDPAWTNKRGYCTVNPKNVATYLRVKAAA